jgi:hypothetical protein
MVAAWCVDDNSTILIDGTIRVGVTIGIRPPNHNWGDSASLISDPLPLSVTVGRHTLAVVTSTGVVSNTVHLNDADLWWVQGDDGPSATAGGWIRAFGRDLTPADADAPSPPPALVRAWETMCATASGYSAEAQLAMFKEMVAGHAEWLTAAPSAPSTVLTLTPVGKDSTAVGDQKKRAALTTLVASAASSYTAEFQVPSGLAPGASQRFAHSSGCFHPHTWISRCAETPHARVRSRK